MAHIAETGDARKARPVVHAEAMRTQAIRDALAAGGVAPSERRLDAGCVGGGHITAARPEQETVAPLHAPHPGSADGSAGAPDPVVAPSRSARPAPRA